MSAPSELNGTWIAQQVGDSDWRHVSLGEDGFGDIATVWNVHGNADANARLIAAAPDMLGALYQYRSDLRHPPASDSVERRLAMIETLIAKATGAA